MKVYFIIYVEFELELIGPTATNSLYRVITIGFDLNDTKQLIDEILNDKMLVNGVYSKTKRQVALHVYESSFLEYFSQLCTKKISLYFLAIFFPFANQEEFIIKLKAFFENKLIHVSLLAVL